MPAFGVDDGENESLIEIVTTYRDEASAGMAATAQQATAMGAAIQSASSMIVPSVEGSRAVMAKWLELGSGPKFAAWIDAQASMSLGTAKSVDTLADSWGGMAAAQAAAMGDVKGAFGGLMEAQRLGLEQIMAQPFEATAFVPKVSFEGIMEEELLGIQQTMTAAKELRVEADKTGKAIGTMMSLWRLRAVARIIRQVDQLGDQLLSTAKGWVEYTARAEEAANVADNVIMTHGELSTIMREQEEAAALMRAELGEALLPAYKDSIEVVTSLKQAVADLSDGWQATIGISTTLVGVFLKVSAAIMAGAVAAMTAQAIYRSLNKDILAQAISYGRYALMLGVVVTAAAAVGIGVSKARENLRDFAAGFRETALEAEMSAQEMTHAAVVWFDSLSKFDQLIVNLQGGLGAVVDEILTAGSKTGTVFEQAARSVEAMILPAAQVFQSLADTQEDIQNEMLTNRREHAKVMADIDKFGYSEQLVAQATALDAQYRQLELADMRAAEAHEGQMGQIVLQTISALERVGRITPEMALEAREAAMLEAGMVTPETIAAGRAFLEEQFPGVMGAGAGAAAITPEAPQVTALVENTTVLGEVRDAIYDWLEGIVSPGIGGGGSGGGVGGVGGYTIGEELQTQGVRMRP